MIEHDGFHQSFSTLNRILFLALIVIFIASILIQEFRPIPLIVISLTCSIIGCQRISTFTYKVLIVILLFFMAVFILGLAYSFIDIPGAEITTFVMPQKKLEPNLKSLMVLIAYFLLDTYALLLCWRSYERTKLYILTSNNFMMN